MLGPCLLKLLLVLALTRMSSHYLYQCHHFNGKNHLSKGPEHIWSLIGFLAFPYVVHIIEARGFKEKKCHDGRFLTIGAKQKNEDTEFPNKHFEKIHIALHEVTEGQSALQYLVCTV